MDNKNYTDFLSESEKKALNNVNNLSNNLSNKNKNDKDIFNQNISQIIQNWSTVQVNIINIMYKSQNALIGVKILLCWCKFTSSNV